jgi:hypothetical protein
MATYNSGKAYIHKLDTDPAGLQAYLNGNPKQYPIGELLLLEDSTDIYIVVGNDGTSVAVAVLNNP